MYPNKRSSGQKKGLATSCRRLTGSELLNSRDKIDAAELESIRCSKNPRTGSNTANYFRPSPGSHISSSVSRSKARLMAKRDSRCRLDYERPFWGCKSDEVLVVPICPFVDCAINRHLRQRIHDLDSMWSTRRHCWPKVFRARRQTLF